MVGLVESVNSWLQDRHGISRHTSAVVLVGSIACLSVFSILSYNVLEEYTLGGMNFNDVMDYFSNQILLPLGGLLIAVFAGWAIKKEYAKDELTTLGDSSFELWHFLIRYIVPPAVLVILISGVVA